MKHIISYMLPEKEGEVGGLFIVIFILFSLILGCGRSNDDAHINVAMELKKIAVAERTYCDKFSAYADISTSAKAGEWFPELDITIPADSPYEFAIEEYKGLITIRAYGNLDSDSTIDTWAMSLNDRSIPICLSDDLIK